MMEKIAAMVCTLALLLCRGFVDEGKVVTGDSPARSRSDAYNVGEKEGYEWA
jgi:hypothetical protein